MTVSYSMLQTHTFSTVSTIWTNSEEEGSPEEVKRIYQNTQAQNEMKNSRTQQRGRGKGRRMLWYPKKLIVTLPTPAKTKLLKPVKILSFLLEEKKNTKPQYYEIRKVLRNMTNWRATAKSKVLAARKRESVQSQKSKAFIQRRWAVFSIRNQI